MGIEYAGYRMHQLQAQQGLPAATSLNFWSPAALRATRPPPNRPTPATEGGVNWTWRPISGTDSCKDAQGNEPVSSVGAGVGGGGP